jgi:membrane-bound ClpP family serine protease
MLTLKKAMTGTSGYDQDAKRAGLAIGERGTASTPLKPSGYGMFGESRVEVHSGGEFIEPKTPIVVVELAAGKVLVEAVSDP